MIPVSHGSGGHPKGLRHALRQLLTALLYAWIAALCLAVVVSGAIFSFVFMGWARVDDKAYWIECCSQVRPCTYPTQDP